MPIRQSAALFLISLLANTTVMAAEAPSAEDIVTAADQIRFPDEGFQVSVHVTSLVPNRDPELHEYQVLQSGHDKSVVRTLAPASEAGQVMLLRGPDLWVFLPEVSQPVRLPLSQRLTGQVANGDLARANFAGDYTATFVKEEDMEGKKCRVLDLIAAHKGVTYHRVLYWVEKGTNRPVKAEFYTLSKRLMKTGLYSEFKELGGKIRPTKLTLIDALKSGEQSVLAYSSLKVRDIPDKVFTKDFLRKLKN